MKISLVLVVTQLLLLSGCATAQAPSLITGEPVVVLVEAAPGYKREMSLRTPDNNVIEIRIALLSQNPSKKWKPTAFIALRSDNSDIVYNLNLNTDLELQKQYVRARVIDEKEQKELSKLTHQELLDLSSDHLLRIEISGDQIRSFVNGNLVEERQLPFAPVYYDIGASSGAYKMTVIEAPPPPSPE